MQIYSPNMLKTFEQCPYKFKLRYEDKISLIQNSKFFEKGKKIHALASYYLQGSNIEKMEKSLNPQEKIDWNTLKTNKYLKMNTFRTEYALSCKTGDFWIGGRLDALVYENSNFYILDYKTGQIPQNAEFDFQTMIYLLAADKFLNQKSGYNSLKFVYLGLKENEEKIIDLTEDNKEKYEDKIIKTCKNIELKSFGKNKKICEFCEYKKLCD